MGSQLPGEGASVVDAQRSNDLVKLGRITGLFGVKGWLKVYSYTEPRENILNFSPWYVSTGGQWQAKELAEGRRHGKAVIARLAEIEDREGARALIGADVAVRRNQLPPPEEGEYYWVDLEGLRVVNLEGVELGTVSGLFETGANDVLVVAGDRERLIPFVRERVIVDVDLESGVIRVDWDPDF